MASLFYMKVYISGAISNRKFEDAQEHFRFAEDLLSLKGYDIINPMKLPHEHCGTWLEYMKEDIIALMDCEAIYMLKGWDLSRGALVEFNIAKELGYKIMFE